MNPRIDAQAIFQAAVERVDPEAMMKRSMRIEDGSLVIDTGLEKAVHRLDDVDRIYIVGAGKASGKMACAVEAILGDRITAGLVAVKDGQLEALERISMVEAGHPVPDERSVRAARGILGIAEQVAQAESEGIRCLVLVLISGGGSALLCAPAEGLSLADKAATTRLLLASGATINEINAVRKHLSAVKGGSLARAFSPATVVALVLSDVIGDDLDVIASGPCTPDASGWETAREVLSRRGVLESLPPAVAQRLHEGLAGRIPDTPKTGDSAFAKARNILIGTNRLALLAAEAEARLRGYNAMILTSRLGGEARELAQLFLAVGRDIEASGFPLARPACLIAGGETTVTIRGKGKGGRNQEMALAFLCGLGGSLAGGEAGEGMLFLSAGTDGNDGPTDAAGAFASRSILAGALRCGLDPADALARNDSYTFYDAAGALLRTGPTGTNVCDIQILLVP